MDEEDDEDDEEEDIEEEELDIGGEIDSPPWDMYGDLDVEDQDETTENTALLRTAAKTEIIVTPISPVSVEGYGLLWENGLKILHHN